MAVDGRDIAEFVARAIRHAANHGAGNPQGIHPRAAHVVIDSGQVRFDLDDGSIIFLDIQYLTPHDKPRDDGTAVEPGHEPGA